MRLLLRLDNGSLIGHLSGDGTVSRVTAAEAEKVGRLGERDRERLLKLLETAGRSSNLSIDPQGSGKRKEPDAREAPLETKRSRPRQANGRRATSDLSHGSSWGNQTDWSEKAREVLVKVLDSLGVEKQWFDRPVDEYYIPGYYSKIKSPMDLGTMSKKLESGKYKNPQAFCEDMRLVWDNCIFFNGKGSKYGKVGDRASAYFEELWASSGLETGNSRHRRTTAGVAATKYEPQEESEPKRALRKQPSTRTAVTSKSARLQEEATSIPMDREQMRALADWMGEIDGEALEGAINIIKERGHGGSGGSEEIELDFDTMDNETLWALDDYMMQMKGGRRESVGKANSGFQVEPESDYESESDGSDD